MLDDKFFVKPVSNILNLLVVILVRSFVQRMHFLVDTLVNVNFVNVELGVLVFGSGSPTFLLFPQASFPRLPTLALTRARLF